MRSSASGILKKHDNGNMSVRAQAFFSCFIVFNGNTQCVIAIPDGIISVGANPKSIAQYYDRGKRGTRKENEEERIAQ